MLNDDDELVRLFDEYIATLPQRPNRIWELQMFGDWRDKMQLELGEWKNELSELESRAVDKQAIFNSARNKIAYLLRRTAGNADLLPENVGIEDRQTAPMLSTLVEPNVLAQTNRKPKGTVKESAIFWLCHVVAEHSGKSVGLTYDEVLERVREEHPSANTSRHSIAFYASHIRRGISGYEGVLPQIRPRSY